jgi:hypothetical protein
LPRLATPPSAPSTEDQAVDGGRLGKLAHTEPLPLTPATLSPPPPVDTPAAIDAAPSLPRTPMIELPDRSTRPASPSAAVAAQPLRKAPSLHGVAPARDAQQRATVLAAPDTPTVQRPPAPTSNAGEPERRGRPDSASSPARGGAALAPRRQPLVASPSPEPMRSGGLVVNRLSLTITPKASEPPVPAPEPVASTPSAQTAWDWPDRRFSGRTW